MALADALMPCQNAISWAKVTSASKVLSFGRKRSLTSERRLKLKPQYSDLLERYLEVEQHLQVASFGVEQAAKGPQPVSSLGDAELAAVKLREHWNLGVNPISVPGLAEFLEEQGVKINALDLPPTFRD